MTCNGVDTLSNMKLTADEVSKLKKAFKDPEFCKLFQEYANEISDPQNRKRYEEEIRQMEKEQGMDVEFVNPVPAYCLKTRHWPRIMEGGTASSEEPTESGAEAESSKVFINVCKSDKVGCPVMKPVRNSSGKQVVNGLCWSLPHCFTPPRDDFDKKKNRATVYDVAFHPKAFELGQTNPTMRRLIDVTAIQGVQRQFNLTLGKTAQQAFQLAALIKQTTDDSGRTEVEDLLLRSVHKLKGTAYKGIPRPTVIRRRRDDYEQCQADLKRRTEEDLKNCSDPRQREALRKLATGPYTQTKDDDPSSKSNGAPVVTKGPITPKYTITHVSDYDMLNCRNAPDVNPVRLPDRLRISVHLPGLVSSACLDLDVTSTHMHLKSEKPVAYQLDLKLPFPVDDTEGSAKFDKATCQLVVVVPVVKSATSDPPPMCSNSPDSDVAPIGESSNPSEQQQRTKRKRRKRHRRASSSTTNSVPPIEGLSLVDPVEISAESTSGDVSTSPTDTQDATVVEQSAVSSTEMSIPVIQVPIEALVVTKERRLAPVRFRQDPFSLSVLLGVRGILPESVRIHWAIQPIPDGSDISLTITDQPPLLLLINFSSRGAGGCTMDWGIVLCYPSCLLDASSDSLEGLAMDAAPPEDISSGKPYSHVYEQNPPRLLNSAFSTTNAVLVFAKPHSPKFKEQPISSELRCMLNDSSIWWTSIAIGRTLTAGMQDCPFAGVDSCLSTDLSTDHPVENPRTSIPSKANVQISTISTEQCVIHWHPPGTEVPSSLSGAVATEPLADVPVNSSASGVGLRGRRVPGGPPIVLKGILKQRSYSESSGDEQSSLRDAGLADIHIDHISSDEFPTASSQDEDEDHNSSRPSVIKQPKFYLRRCVSSEKLNSSSQGDAVGPGRRQRRRSVNFSTHDQHVAFSPKDTVDALRHALLNRRKKARRRETRRRFLSGETASQHLKYGGFAQKNSDSFAHSLNNSVPVADTCMDPVIQVPELPTVDESGSTLTPSESSGHSSGEPISETPATNGTVEEASQGDGSNQPTPEPPAPMSKASAVKLCASSLMELDED